jgi:hypothetical protein
MRGFLIVLVMLLLPAVLYFTYVSYARSRADATGEPLSLVRMPWSWLAIAGGLLVIVSFLAYSLLGIGSGSGAYHPARIINGTVEEGYFDERAN